MKITRLTKVKNYRIFRNFSWPTTGLIDFAQLNVIYGWNGAGKTSLSNIFRQMQKRTAITEGEIEILVDQNRVLASEFDQVNLPNVRTFNRDTVNRNVFEVVNQELPPVFYLGEDSIEKQKRIEELTKKRTDNEANLRHWNRKLIDSRNAEDSLCRKEAQAIKNLLTVAGGGSYNDYNKAHFRNTAKRLSTTPRPNDLSDEERQQCLSIKDGKPLNKIDEISIEFPDIPSFKERVESILKRSIVTSVIEKLVEQPELATWVQAGLRFHQSETDSQVCQFCDQPLPDKRVEKLESHFNDELTNFQTQIDDLVIEMQAAKNFTNTFIIPAKDLLYPDLRTTYEQATKTLTQQQRIFISALDVLLTALHAKRNEPFKSFSLATFLPNKLLEGETALGVELLLRVLGSAVEAIGIIKGVADSQKAFEKLIGVIRAHNERTDSFEIQVTKARNDLARDQILAALEEWKENENKINEADLQVKELQAKTDAL